MNEYEIAAEAAKSASTEANDSPTADSHRAAAARHRIAAEHARMNGGDNAKALADTHGQKSYRHDEAARALEACVNAKAGGENIIALEASNPEGINQYSKSHSIAEKATAKAYKSGEKAFESKDNDSNLKAAQDHQSAANAHKEAAYQANKIDDTISHDYHKNAEAYHNKKADLFIRKVPHESKAHSTLLPKLNELSGRRMAGSKALEASLADSGYSLNDLQSEVREACNGIAMLNKPNDATAEGMVNSCCWVTDIVAPPPEQGETWTAIVQGADGKLYGVDFTVDEEVEVVGDPKEVERVTDYDYVGDMEAEARRAVEAGAIEAGGPGSGPQKSSDAATNVKEMHAWLKEGMNREPSTDDVRQNLFFRHGIKMKNEDVEKHLNARAETAMAARASADQQDRKPKQKDALDCASKDAAAFRTRLNPVTDGVLMYMPGGVSTITPSQNGKAVTVTVEVTKASAAVLEEQRESLTAAGKKPFFSVQHDTEIAAFWPSRFFWDKRVDATGSAVEGVWAEGEWTKSGKDAVEGKDFRTFSPTFFVDAIRNDPKKPCEVVCNDDARANMGALENDPAFQEMSPLWARRAGTAPTVQQQVRDALEALRARNPSLTEVRDHVFTTTGRWMSEDDVATALLPEAALEAGGPRSGPRKGGGSPETRQDSTEAANDKTQDAFAASKVALKNMSASSHEAASEAHESAYKAHSDAAKDTTGKQKEFHQRSAKNHEALMFHHQQGASMAKEFS